MSHYVVNILLLTHILNIYTACRVGDGLPSHESTTIPATPLQCMAYIDSQLHRGTIMDARKFDRNADLLMQLRRNISQIPTRAEGVYIGERDLMLELIEEALKLNDTLGNLYGKGLV